MPPPEGSHARLHYQEDLASLEQRTLAGLDLVTEALDGAVRAVRDHDVELAELVIASDDQLDGRYLEVHQAILALLATQAPVAGDLRLVAALLHVMKNIERMGDQCVNVAKLVPLAGTDPPLDPEIVDNIVRMGDSVRAQISQARRAFQRRDPELAADLVHRDEVVDEANKDCFRRAVQIGDDPERREWAMSMMLAARAIERIGDNTVDIGEQVAFLVRGIFREFEDASHPEEAPDSPQNRSEGS